MARDLDELEARYREHEHEFPEAWLDYGEIDPLEIHQDLIFHGRNGEKPGIRKVDPDMHLVMHEGGEVIQCRHAWEAIIAWNRSAKAQEPRWQDLPFFFLSELSPDEARYKLSKMRPHLELRWRLLKMRWMSGQPMGWKYLARIKAYREWCELTQQVFKRQQKAPRHTRQQN